MRVALSIVSFWVVVLQVLLFAEVARADEVESKPLTWYQFDSPFETHSTFSSQELNSSVLTKTKNAKLTGGHFLSILEFSIVHSGWYVVDFSGTGLIGKFNHQIINGDQQAIASFSGGVESNVENTYMLRNGRRVFLNVGDYQLLTRQQSQFNIATPTPYLKWEPTYLKSIKTGNAITLFGLGIFAGLGLFYFVLAIYRKQKADFAYSIFILGNLLFNATTLLAFSDILGISWYSGASYPILISNIAYIFFVVYLLNIKKATYPRLHNVAVAIICLLTLFLISAPLIPNYQMEMERAGVGLFLLFGLGAGIRIAITGCMVARLYLIANVGFFVLAMVAITQDGIAGEPTISMSHIGLVAVAIEVVLLSFVLAYQMNMISKEKAIALSQAKELLQMAQTDSLTKTLNRYALDNKLKTIGKDIAFYYLDLDGLKACNDERGHMFGDALLSQFATHLQQKLGKQGSLYRIGGDEFGLLHKVEDSTAIMQLIEQTQQHIRDNKYEKFGISCGLAKNSEHSSPYRMVEVADHRMYKEKTTKRANSFNQTSSSNNSIAS